MVRKKIVQKYVNWPTRQLTNRADLLRGLLHGAMDYPIGQLGHKLAN